MIKTLFAASLLALSGTAALAAENSNATGSPFANPIAVTQGRSGAGAAGNNASATGNPLGQPLAVSESSLPPLLRSLAQTNHATASDPQGLAFDGQPLATYQRRAADGQG